MEFPAVGLRCSSSECKQLDFLPFTCSYCQLIFCKEHFHVAAHKCSKFADNTVLPTGPVQSYRCSTESCDANSPVEMPCIKCKLHFCLAHRHHGCLDRGEEEKSEQLEKWNKPKEEFLQAKATVDKQINTSLRKAKNASTANKVQLMRIKGQAVGVVGIPADERRYFLVYPPLRGSIKTTRTPKAIFTCNNWSLGRTIDAIANLLSVQNTNNIANSPKLRLFRCSTGSIVSQQMDVFISELLNNSSLINGESLILEYSNDQSIDVNLYQ